MVWVRDCPRAWMTLVCRDRVCSDRESVDNDELLTLLEGELAVGARMLMLPAYGYRWSDVSRSE